MATLNDIGTVEDWERLSPAERLRILDELRAEVIHERDKAAILVTGGVIYADTPVGRITFPLRIDNIRLAPGDTLQLTWSYEGFAGQ